MENGESTNQAAMRETSEESGAHIELHELFSLINVIHVDQVHLFYRATLLDLDYAAGTESLEVALFSEEELPWENLAFQTSILTLKYFFEQTRQSKNVAPFKLFTHDIIAPKRAV